MLLYSELFEHGNNVKLLFRNCHAALPKRAFLHIEGIGYRVAAICDGVSVSYHNDVAYLDVAVLVAASEAQVVGQYTPDLAVVGIITENRVVHKQISVADLGESARESIIVWLAFGFYRVAFCIVDDLSRGFLADKVNIRLVEDVCP